MPNPFLLAANRHSFVLLLTLLAVVLTATVSTRPANATASSLASPPDQFFGIYVGASRIGKSHVHTAPDSYQGSTALLETSVSETSLIAFGTTISQKVVGETWTDSSGKNPLYETVSISSGGAATNISAKFFPDHIDATMTSGSSTSHKRIDIPTGTQLSASDFESGVAGASSLHVGEQMNQSVFDPVTLALDNYTVKVVALNADLTDEIVGVVHGLTRCEITGPEGDVTVYQDSAGNPVRMDMAAGLVMRREVNAPDANVNDVSPTTYVPPTDFAVSTAVAPTGEPIVRPRDCRLLRIELSSPGEDTRTVTVQSVPIAPTKTTVTDATKDSALASYLGDAPYLDLDSVAVRDQAAKIRGESDNLYDLAMRTHDWVNANMLPVASLGLPRSASSILGDMRGVCRDYATLYASLARAEGVPTRVCAGIVSFRDKFYYHAWDESYVGGATGWLPVDSTMTTKIVDATHVALSTGDPASIYTVSGKIGKLQATILEAGY